MSNNAITVATAAAQLNHALGDPVPEKAIGFFAGLWAFVVSFAKTLWESILSAWKPANYLALMTFFLAGVALSDFTLRYVRVFSVLAVVLIGLLFISMVMKKTNR